MAGDSCKECGTAIPADSPGGFCAQCLFGLGLKEVQNAKYGGQNEGGEQTAKVEGPPEEAKPLSRVAALLTETPGDRIGRYRLLQEIGHGGCGVVYMAEQQEPVRRKVALKVIKLGMDTRQVVARFEAERQALALMDHPNIAKVLDAGATDAGRPYFVMELVGGIKITDYCDQNDLTTRQRLDLFIQVCRAVQHAHQKGIIHRDIKPSNILVATHDGVAVPKVIDFGIAKATQGRLTDQTLFTAFEQFLGTPAYMSPEQAQLGGLDIDTRSDIYSLGVLLYELLTNTTPFDTKELMAAGLDEMRRTIREVEPLKPSARRARGLAAHAGDSSKSKVKSQKSKIPRDLDWIVMKCLEKERARRYETADGLARDIERHLNSEPVFARPPSRIYNFHKLYRRNRLAFATALLFLVLGVSSGGGIFWQWQKATRHAELERKQRQRAQTALTRMEAIGLRRAEEYYQARDRRSMLPYLALVLRENPSNRIAAGRLFSTLSHRDWARLACPPLMHSNGVTSARFSHDGRWVVTSAADSAWVWDANTGERLSGPLTHHAEINDTDFSPDGQLVVTVSDDSTARIWDARTGRPVTDPIPHPARVNVARFSPDSQAVVTLCDDRAARLWNVRTGKPLLEPLRHGEGARSEGFFEEADFSPDGSLLVTAAIGEGPVRVWSCRTGAVAHELNHGSSGVTCVRFSPDGERLAAALYTNRTVIWDLASNPPREIMLPQKGTIASVEFSHDGARIVTASTDGTAQVWDVHSGKPIGPPLHHGGRVRCAIFSPDGHRVVTASHDQTIRVWDAETGEAPIEPMAVGRGAYYAQFHADGQRVLSASNGRAVLLWWVNETVAPSIPTPSTVNCVEFSPEGARVFVGGEDGLAQILDPLTGHQLSVLSGHSDSIVAAAFSADGGYIATGSRDGSVRLFVATTGKPVARPIKIGLAGTEVFNVRFSPDGKTVLTGSALGARLWDTISAEPASPPMGEEDGVRACQFSPDGRWVATGGTNGMVRIWDAMAGRPAGLVMRHDAEVLAIRFSPDGKRLLTGSADKTARLWAVPSGESLAAPIQHSLPLYNVHFSPQGDRFLTVIPDLRVRVWDSATARLLNGGFADGASWAEFSPDGSRIVTRSSPGLAQLWDAQTGERLSEPMVGQSPTADLRLTPDGKMLVAASAGGVRFWDVAPSALPVPSWLPELAEAVAGLRLNQQGRLEPVSPGELWAVQRKLTALVRSRNSNAQPAPLGAGTMMLTGPESLPISRRDAPVAGFPQPFDDSYLQWAKWFVSTPPTRTVLPSSPLTLAQYGQSFAEQRSMGAAARTPPLLEPTNVATNALRAELAPSQPKPSGP